MRTRRLLTVLTYHRVERRGVRPELDPALVSAEPEEFERHVGWLARRTNPISLVELVDVKRGLACLPARAVLVTFDDAYRDFAVHAWPILRRHAVPVALFVPTGYPAHDLRCFWWDRLHAALWRTPRLDPIDTPAGRLSLATDDDRRRAHRALARWVADAPHDDAMASVELICTSLGEPETASPLLDWDELRALAREGVTLAPHTRTHPRLDRVSLSRARDEIAGSRDDLAREIPGAVPPAIALPGGGHQAGLGRILTEEGFELAFTTRRGPNLLPRADWLRLRRSNVGRRTTLPVLKAQLAPWALPAV
ncbi:MAG TPA: polysaccharide deacetylase family protein, partial [Thermoleophilaceae bacterium]|nr:polysaccharide deacetylase family protein [Thermoleophilaceae bacterium]